MSLHSEIHVGYEIGTGRAVSIPLRHMAITGQTQESGKTTTLEAAISRSGLKAIAYVTKRGESSFHVANPIPPYFQERADWQFVQSLLEAAMSTKMDFKQPWIMRVSDGAKSLQDVRANLRRFLDGVPAASGPRRIKHSKKGGGGEFIEMGEKKRWLQKPATGLSADVYYVLDKYFDDVMPQIQNLPYSTKLELAPGLNVMDLRDYDFAVQALVVRSVTDRIRQHEEKTVNIIPEAWKFAPKQRGSPVRLAAEEYVRESAAMKNFLWVDSQDLAGVADVIMRQVGVWIFGVQRAKHEIERALDHMPEGLPSRRPRPADIATLGKGQFYVCFGREMFKVYVQPAWMTAAHAEAIARGEEDVESAREILKEFDSEQKTHQRMAVQSKSQRVSDAGSNVRGDGKSGRSDSSDGSAATGLSGEEEVMWKEKYDALRRNIAAALHVAGKQLSDADLVVSVDMLRSAHDTLAERIRASEEAGETVLHVPARPPAAANGAAATDFEGIYAYFRKRAAEDPVILQLLQQQPELRVKRERRTIEMDDDTVPGAIAGLIAAKFFDVPHNGYQTFLELQRRGRKCAKVTVNQALSQVAELGFLTREEEGYRAVPGMKINIVEA